LPAASDYWGPGPQGVGIFDSRVKFNQIRPRNDFIENRNGHLEVFTNALRLPMIEIGRDSDVTQPFDKRGHAGQPQSFDEFVGRRLMGIS
jgi:hypothetical protein